MWKRLLRAFSGRKEAMEGVEQKDKPLSAKLTAVQAWERNETEKNDDKRKAIFGDDGQLVEVISAGGEKPSFAILLNGKKYPIVGNLVEGLPNLIDSLQNNSAVLAEWIITSVQLVNYEDKGQERSCYFLTGFPMEENLDLLDNDRPIQ